MCGIVGFASPRLSSYDHQRLDGVCDLIAHRGPDARGTYADERVHLGFRRLSILDLRQEGNQPMPDSTGKLIIVFNGEIYNYIELRSELEARGHTFITNTDTEVLLNMYREYGKTMFAKLNGMFAFAIYDRERAKLVLARDRMGKKPLFYRKVGQELAFSSELVALKELPGFSKDLNAEAIELYFRLGWVPSAYCIFEGVKKIPPSSWMEFDLANWTLHEPQNYWRLPPVRYEEGIPEDEWLERIENLLRESIRIRLRSDVPVGVFLSGGIDSGLVAALAKSIATTDLSAITVAFPGWHGDESSLAKETADHVGLHAATVVADGLADGISSRVISHFDEPFSDASSFPTEMLCAAARKKCTVALSGDGADEVFAGYSHHVKAQTWKYLEWIPLGLRKAMSEMGTIAVSGNARLRRIFRRLGHPVAMWGAGCTLDPFPEWMPQYLRPEYHRAETVETLALRIPNIPATGTHPLDFSQRLDLRLYMHDDILVKVDRMSMFNSLEVRSPFLDYRLVELALRIPTRLRVRLGKNKYLLRRIAERLLPRRVAEGPKKGFGIPLGKWIYESHQSEQFREILACPSSTIQDPVLKGKGEALWKEAQQRPELIYPLFQVLVFRIWSAVAVR